MTVSVKNTKFSDIDLDFVKQYLRIEPEFTDDDLQIELFIETAKSFVIEHTQMTEDELDSLKVANIIYLKMISDMYSNRNATLPRTIIIDPIFELLQTHVRNYTLGTVEKPKDDEPKWP